jgi:excinuclease ABC subunit B
LYADVITDSMGRAMNETDRRRALQKAYNQANGITPETIIKPIDMSLVAITEADYVDVPLEVEQEPDSELSPEDRDALIAELEVKMRQAAKIFEFEKAAQFRDRIKALKTSGVYEPSAATRAHH